MPRISTGDVIARVAAALMLVCRPDRPFTTAYEASIVMEVTSRHARRILRGMALAGLLIGERLPREGEAGSEPFVYRLDPTILLAFDAMRRSLCPSRQRGPREGPPGAACGPG